MTDTEKLEALSKVALKLLKSASRPMGQDSCGYGYSHIRSVNLDELSETLASIGAG